ncbi:MAG: response regulator [Nitrospinae bacterium]|nr:response regulator [Nitrospinota bacterium]MBF0635444.1 response regulator [Nitrospinota bacterium]
MTKDGAGLKILLAEDNHFNQQITTITLQKHGYAVDVADSGRQTIEKWMAGHYDLILMDLEMPDLDGLEATAAIRRIERERGGHIPIFAVSAHHRASYLDRCVAAGMDDYLAKPVNPLDLEIRIKDHSSKTAPPSLNMAQETALFDLSSLRDMFSENEVRELATLFVKRGREMIVEISSAISKKDAVALKLKAHQLKGSSSQIYAGPLTRVAAKMEHLAEKSEFEEVGPVFVEMKAVFDVTARALEKETQA